MPIKWRAEQYALILGVLVLVALFIFLPGTGPGKQVGQEVYQSPKLLKTIRLAPGDKPAWVYSIKDRLYVSYFGLDKVDIFTPEGKKASSFRGTLKPGGGSPQGMALVGERLLVADYANRALLAFNPLGKYMESFSQRPDGEEFVPVGVAVYNRVFYIADKQAKGWMAIGDDGEFINVIKGTNEQNRLEFPYGIVVTEDGRVVITDPQRGKIKVFTCAGWYAYDFPAAEIGLRNPQGIALDGLGRIHVVDNGTNQVFVYDNKGYFLFKYGKKLDRPANITIDRERRVIYIANTEKANISVWKY